MDGNKRPLTPVKPSGLEIICFYPCPFCTREVPLVAPTQPAMVRCDACGKDFPIVPVDERGLRFVKIMTGNGRSAVDPDFL
ncbi:hypothetical protein [Desulfocurvus sp.]|jgi:uncharacterized Zn finger protein|uniref:hypothetical protein n=1 Tax=Desulfocurvus sp. TaxID=2871698 RepID=UPI0025BFE01D|nr:hypothetical protein [Desulfocurvus sp.]MCK9240649.1 hypothetical protein [Desulfocurvus sp.]